MITLISHNDYGASSNKIEQIVPSYENQRVSDNGGQAAQSSFRVPCSNRRAINFEARMLESEMEAEICQRFVRLSCEKMIMSRNSRSGARLHRSLLILRLLRKARSNTKMLPYECSGLLKCHQYPGQKIYATEEDNEEEEKDTFENVSTPQMNQVDSMSNINANSSEDENINLPFVTTENTSAIETTSSSNNCKQIDFKENYKLEQIGSMTDISYEMAENALNNTEVEMREAYNSMHCDTLDDLNENNIALRKESDESDDSGISSAGSQESLNSSSNSLSPQNSLTNSFEFPATLPHENEPNIFGLNDFHIFEKEKDLNENGMPDRVGEESATHRSFTKLCQSNSTFSSLSVSFVSSSTTSYNANTYFENNNLFDNNNNINDNNQKLENINRHFNGRLYERIGNMNGTKVNYSSHKTNEEFNTEWETCLNAETNNKVTLMKSETNNVEIIEEGTDIAAQLFPTLPQTYRPYFTPQVRHVWSTPMPSFSSFPFQSEDEMPNLQTVMVNPVSPPLDSMRSDTFLDFSNLIKSNFCDMNDLTTNLNKTKTNNAEHCTNNQLGNKEFCCCNTDLDFLSFDEDESMNEFDVNEKEFNTQTDVVGAFCRKRKTNESGRTDIFEKRYCCKEDETSMTILSQKITRKSESWSSADDVDVAHYCTKCGKQNAPLSNNSSSDDFDDDDNFNNYKPLENVQEAFSHSYQQNYQHFGKSFRFYEQHNASKVDHVVPIARRSHFVGPIVGLVSKTPRILMF